jgi:Ca-activated chloride channel homolog
VAGFSGTGWAQDTDQVPDPGRVTAPVPHPSKGASNPVSITIELDPGFPLARLDSAFHRVKIDDLGGNRKRVTLANGETPASRDFELTWAPDPGSAPAAALFSEARAGNTYALLMVMPPIEATWRTATGCAERTA